MKRIVNVIESSGDGLEKLLGECVQVWCVNYIYAGRLVGVNTNDIVLEEAGVVYQTGKLGGKSFEVFEPCGVDELFIRTSAIESYSLAPQLVK